MSHARTCIFTTCDTSRQEQPPPQTKAEAVICGTKDHDEWTALQEHSEEKTGRAFIRGVFGYGNITAFDLSNEAVNLFIQQCPPYGAWTHLGATTTDKGA